ncbi:Thymidylate kinase [Metamycoplasma arthritidis]|uniref:Thymidylate kinase n=1 Tax=Metamycoplasma arthritidis (strain 158L3-1) TaxID=243272 RepID=B3PM37_META1|nr:dTMP kinase [Metamycoplasma arthritidis]ACF07089.1 thymidylate kinase [Metamycoplasma arthritidis 158L3-1]VEU78617.1 Thymidylate kinase [Metamycoplasma arthritidis]
MNKKAKFITIEGMDGSGKTTIIEMLKDYLFNIGKIDDFVFTREPGSAYSAEAENIRKIVLDSGNKFSPMVDALLFVTSRRINLEKAIWPALKAKKNVISDRFWHSSFVYQGILGKVGLDKVRQINEMVIEDTQPDFVIFFDLQPEVSVERLTKLREKTDRLETDQVEYYQALRKAYFEVINSDPTKFRIIDASQSIVKVFEQLLIILKNEGVL